ncbi:alpha/beta fold hydrolase [Pseudonocardia phyllosphaerae]|uniref:alpha/beta fold hydrolase n=1 Tax=Pseudonocardia phyllosphaerae TaxID=3390502 RepID=UPI00397A677F
MTVRTGDGLSLAVQVRGEGPTVVAVHGYPDDHHVWDGVADALVGSGHRVVTYDVRGAGASGVPGDRAGYDLELLAADLRAVCDAVSPAEPVHLLAHDWGAIQTWHAVTGDALTGRVASFTSISGPCLDHVARFLGRRARRDLPAVARQMLHSWYTVFFRIPVLPELLIRSGLLGRIVARSERIAPPDPADAVHGLELYRRNLPRRLGNPQIRRTDLPVQILCPRRDAYVGTDMAVSAAPFAPDLRVRHLPGGHWVVRHRPDEVAGPVAELVAETTGDTVAPGLERARTLGSALVATGGRALGR